MSSPIIFAKIRDGLIEAATTGKYAQLMRYLSHDKIQASMYNQDNVIYQVLIQSGMSPDIVYPGDVYKRTLLHLAARNNRASVTKQLTLAGANVNARDATGYTALDDAAWVGASTDVVSLLLWGGADLHENDGNIPCWTALHNLYYSDTPGRVDIAHLLIPGVDVWPQNLDDTAPCDDIAAVFRTEHLKRVRWSCMRRMWICAATATATAASGSGTISFQTPRPFEA